MKLTDLKTEIQFDFWIMPQLKDTSLGEGYIKFQKSGSPEEFLIFQKGAIVSVTLRDSYIKNDLEFYLKRGCAQLSHIVQTGNDGSCLIRVHFFNGQIVEIGDIDVAVDDRISETAKRNGFKFNTVEGLAKLLNERTAIEIGKDEAASFFLINTGAAADEDFDEEPAPVKFQEDDGEEYEEEHTNNDGGTNYQEEEIETLPVLKQVKCFSIFGDGFKMPTEKRTLKYGEEIFFATKFINFMGKKPDAALKLAKGTVNFTTAASRISALAAGEMNRILQEKGSYLKQWDRYAALEGDLLLDKARSVGKIKITGFEPGEKGTKFFVEKIPEFLSKDDLLEITSNTPEYLANSQLTWEQYCQELDRDFKFNKGLKTTEEGEEVKEKQKKTVAKVINMSNDSITLDLQLEVDIKNSFLIYSIYGDQVQIDRKLKARRLIQQGRCANPLLGLVIEEGAKIPNVQRVTKLKPLTPFVQKKIFKNPPTERQIQAIDIALNTPDIALIQGPPGTGKTTVITAIIERLNEIQEKTKSIKGQVLVSAFQHDAVENIISRLRVNSLPAIKFGKRSGTAETNEDIANERMMHWSYDIAQKIREKNPQLTQLKEQGNLVKSFELYAKSPSTKNAVDLLKQVINIPRDIISPEQVRAATDLIELIEGEEKLNLEDNKEILSMVRALRVTETGFSDDGHLKASDLYMKIEELLSLEEKRAFRKAIMWKEGSSLEFLEAFKDIKLNLLERFTPHPLFKVDKPRADVLELFSDVREQFKKYSNRLDEKSNILANFLHELEDNPNGVRDSIADYNFVFAATVQAAEGRDIRRNKTKDRSVDALIKYDTVIVDEAARTSPLDLLIPMTQAEKRIILVGDHRQLPHLVNEEIAYQLDEESGSDKSYSEKDFIKKSMFEYLFNRLRALEKADGICRTVTLDAQYRTHPVLGQFVSDMFYKEHGEGYRSPLGPEYFRHNLPGTSNSPLMWMEVAEGKDNKDGTSRIRKSEAELIAEKINYWIHSEEGKNLSFGVISFYKAQVNLIYEELGKHKLTQRVENGWQIASEYRYLKDENGRDTSNERLKIGTVDAFQGMEFDVVFLSVVRTYNPGSRRQIDNEKDLNKAISSQFGRLISENLLCVSMSRQKRLLIAVGDSRIVKTSLAKKAVPGLVEFYRLCSEKGVIL